jgi:diketogulonate reductase-like aldo/keto reductase
MSATRHLLRSHGLAPQTQLPTLVYGTAWKKEHTAELVYTGIRSGFRAIDTAAQPKHYREDLVGEGIRRAASEGLVKREDIYVSPHSKACPGAAVRDA